MTVLLRKGKVLDLLLMKRAQVEDDPWSGHMALPGGRRDPRDRTLLETAIRETREETAIPLERVGEALGRLETVGPRGPELPRLAIIPYVFRVGPETEARVASPEVEALHWVPLHRLQAPGIRDRFQASTPSGPREFPCFRIGGEVVWGLTYRILDDLLKRLVPSG